MSKAMKTAKQRTAKADRKPMAYLKFPAAIPVLGVLDCRTDAERIADGDPPLRAETPAAPKAPAKSR